MLFDHLLLHFAREMVPHFIWPERAVQQECRAGFSAGKDIHAFEKGSLMAADEICAFDEIRRTNWLRAKPEVRDRRGAGLFGVVYEISLGVIFGVLTDDLDGILVRDDGA